MADSIRITTFEHMGVQIAVDVEEGKNFRRLTFTRSRYMFGELKKVGAVHFFPDEITRLHEVIDNADWVMQRLSATSFEEASVEWAQSREKL